MAAEINAQIYFAFYNLGILSLMFGDIDEAQKYFYEAIKGSAVEAKGYYNLARISVIKGEKENAINYLNQAINIDPRLSHKAIEDNVFIPIKKYIHIVNEIEEKD